MISLMPPECVTSDVGLPKILVLVSGWLRGLGSENMSGLGFQPSGAGLRV